MQSEQIPTSADPNDHHKDDSTKINDLNMRDAATAVAAGEKSSNIDNLDFDNPDILNNLECPISEVDNAQISAVGGPSPVNNFNQIIDNDEFKTTNENIVNSEAKVSPNQVN